MDAIRGSSLRLRPQKFTKNPFSLGKGNLILYLFSSQTDTFAHVKRRTRVRLCEMVDPTGLEPVTFSMSRKRSNQLS